MKTAILASYYVDAMNFASTEETRFYLRGALLEPGGLIVATDGHTMFAANAAHDPDAFRSELPEDRIIPFHKPLLAACKAKSKSKLPRFLVIEHGPAGSLSFTARVISGNLEDVLAPTPVAVEFTWEGCFIDGTFPDWRRVLPVMPDEPCTETPAFNARYLARFSEVAGNAGKYGGAIRVVPTGKGTPALVDLGREDAFGVIIPFRWDTPRGIPAWVKR